MRYALVFCLLASPASAACRTGEQVFMSCQIEQSTKTVSVCYDEMRAYYRFGVAGQVPELSLAKPIADLDYRPWNGLGKDIWEEIRFRVGPYEYAVHGGYERPWGDELPEDNPYRNFGAVSVAYQGEVFMDLECDRATIDFTWADDILRAKERLGFVWDDRAREWSAKTD